MQCFFKERQRIVIKTSETNNNKTIYLVDGSSYIYRAYHAIRGLSNSQGLPTNAIFGFTRMLIKLLEDRKPIYLIMLFDYKGPTFRHKIYEKYKANRLAMPDDLCVQIPYIKEVTQGLNLPSLELEGFEADDLIGTLATKAEKAGFSVIVVTGDKDFMQLVTENIQIWDPMKDKAITMDIIRKSLGLEPSQMIDVMGLSGDTSDNIPGVPGIGTKTAVSLIQTYGNLDHLYENVDNLTRKKQKENLIKFKDQAYLSRKLVKIDRQAPVEFIPESFRLSTTDNDKLSRLFKVLEFRQLQQNYPALSDLKGKNYHCVQDLTSLKDLVILLNKSERFAIDTETTSQNPMKAELVGLSFSVRPGEAFYIPCGHKSKDAPLQLKKESILEQLRPVLENQNIKKIGQNIKYDWLVLNRHGIFLKGVSFDTMVASYLINPSKRAHNLDQIALDFLDHKTISYEDVTGKGKNAIGFDKVPLDKALPYACEDADITLMAADALKPRLEEIGVMELFEKVELPLIPVLMRMEQKGIFVDIQRLQTLSELFGFQLKQLEQEIYSLAGEQFNINSSQQLCQILFEKLNLPVQKKTKKKSGYSTDVSVLTILSSTHELPAYILRHRTLSKLKTTYADSLIDLVHPETGRIHTSYNQTITSTGRLSSSDPNLQNIPIRTEEGREIRSAFIPQEGWLLMAADYSQIELRILAHYSNDVILIDAFRKDEDIHTRTASEIFNVFPEMMDSELRRQAKIINFGIIYGMGPFRLSNELGISQKMAKTYINNYFSRYRGVKAFIDQTIENARETSKTSTLLGRIRLLPEINSTNNIIRQAAERTAINTPIQGTAADLIKVAMINVDKALLEKKLRTAMLLTVHDELVFEVPPEEIHEAAQIVKDIMENVWNLKVPLKVNIQSGKNWAEAH
jgi:DNA polymerase I